MFDRSANRRCLHLEQFEARLALSAMSLLSRNVSDNTTRTARDLGSLEGTVAIQQYVGPFDERDVFRFELEASGEANIRLQGMTADADLYLLNSQRQTVASSRNGGRQVDSIQEHLTAGEYFVVVQNYHARRGTQYSLYISASLAAQDPFGNTFRTAKDLGSLRGAQTMRDAVGSLDDKDVFRFDIDETSRIDLTLSGLSADVDLHLYSQTGVQLISSDRSGSQSEQIKAWIAKGSYYLVVDAYRGADSPYTLRLESSLAAVPGDPDPPQNSVPSEPNDEGPGRGPETNPDSDAPAPELPRSGDELPPEPESPDASEPLTDVPYFGSVTRDWGINAVNAPEAWAAGYTGEGITVAVIDSGVQVNHPDLLSSIWVNAAEIPGDGIDNDRNGYVDDVRGWDFIDRDNSPTDENGHGTHVAGIIAAANNSVGGTGVAYASTIMPIRVLDEVGSGSTNGVAQGIRYAVDNGAQIINLSLGGGNSQSVYSALRYAEQNDVLVVAASGNESAGRPGFPAAHSASLPNVLSVGAYTSSGHRASFSNQVGSSGSTQVDAPGQSIYNTYLGGRYSSLSGTSMATPFVSGVAALALAANPALSANLLRNVITQSVSTQAMGSDSLGRVNAAAAIPLARTGRLTETTSTNISASATQGFFSTSQRTYALNAMNAVASWAVQDEELEFESDDRAIYSLFRESASVNRSVDISSDPSETVQDTRERELTSVPSLSEVVDEVFAETDRFDLSAAG